MKLHIGDKVRAKKALYWSDGREQHLHALADDLGEVYDISSNDGSAHIFVRFEVGHEFGGPLDRVKHLEHRQTWGQDIGEEYAVVECLHVGSKTS